MLFQDLAVPEHTTRDVGSTEILASEKGHCSMPNINIDWQMLSVEKEQLKHETSRTLVCNKICIFPYVHVTHNLLICILLAYLSSYKLFIMQL